MKTMDGMITGDRKDDCYRFLLISEDPQPECRALALFNRLAQRLASHFECVQQRWQFAELEDPTVRQETARAVGQSDVVILALSGTRIRSYEVRLWIEELLSRENRAAGPVVVLDHATVNLKGGLANRRPVDLFIRDWQPSGGGSVPLTEEAPNAGQPILMTAAPAPALWGINE